MTDHEAPARRSDLGVMVGLTSRQITEAYRDAQQQLEDDEAVDIIGEMLSWR